MNLKKRALELLPLLIFVSIVGIVFLNTKVPVDFLYRYIPVVMVINFVIIVVSFSLNLDWIARQFSSVKKIYWIMLLLVLIMGFGLRYHVTPATHRLYFDEDIYLNIAQNIVNDGRAIFCNYGIPEKCYAGELNKQPQGLSVGVSVVYFIFGVSEKVSHNFMIFISTFSILLIFLVTYLMFKNEIIALFSALLLTFNPISIIFAPTTTGSHFFVFFSLITFFALFLYLKKRSSLNLIFFMSSLAFTVQIRPEALLFIVPLSFFLYREKVTKHIFFGTALFLLLLSPFFLHSNHFIDQGWGSPDGNKFDLKFVQGNLKDNGGFFFDNLQFPLLFTVLSFFGVAYLLYRKKYLELYSLLAWFGVFFAVYLFFYAGSFNYGVDVRYSQMLFAPIFILGGLGAYFLMQKLDIFIESRKGSTIIIIMLIGISFIPYIDFVDSIWDKAKQSRTDHNFALESAKGLGEDCFVFTHVPTMFLVNGINAVQTFYYNNERVVNNVFNSTSCVLFNEGYWCVDDKEHRDGICKRFKETFNLMTYKKTTLGSRNYTLYWVSRK